MEAKDIPLAPIVADKLPRLPGDSRHTAALINPRRLGHITLETADLECAIEYHTDVLGLFVAARESGRVFLVTREGFLTTVLTRGAENRGVALGFEVPIGADFAAMQAQLAGHGIESGLVSDAVPGHSQSLRFMDPKGTCIELFTGSPAIAECRPTHGIGPLKLGHVAFCVSDVLAIAKFYSSVLGFRVSDWIGDDFVFMRCSPDHHTVNFISGRTVKVHHIAYELKDFAHLQASSDVLGARRIPIIRGPLRLGAGHNVATYHRSSDGHIIELFAELDRMTDEGLGYFEPRPWHRHSPQRPQIWERSQSTIWGTPPAPDFLRGRD